MDDIDTLDLAALTREAGRLGYVRAFTAYGRAAWFTADPGLNASAVLLQVYGGGWSLHGHDVGARDEAAALRWLLAQPEAVARAGCYDRGREAGRAEQPPWPWPSLCSAHRERRVDCRLCYAYPDTDAHRAAGAAEERARAVAWLRDEAGRFFLGSPAERQAGRHADALERGEHEVSRG